MKERIVHKAAKHKLLIALLFSCIAFICFSYKTNAQGWSFTWHFQSSGFCPNGGTATGIANSLIPQSLNFGIPTKNQCESMSQTFSSTFNSVMQPVYECDNGDPPKCGYCYITLVCTPCTGSDIATTGLVNPGDVSFDYQFKGKPFFVTHESEAFKEWAIGYKQQLASYGITSILGQKIIPHQIPLTGDKNFDDFYNNQMANFNPTTTPLDTFPNQEPNVVDSNGMKGVVTQLKNKEDEEKLEKYLKECNYFANMYKIDLNNPTIYDVSSGENEIKGDIISILIEKVVTTLTPISGLQYSISNFKINLAKAVFGNLQPAVNANVGTGSYDDVMSYEQSLNKASKETFTYWKWILGP